MPSSFVDNPEPPSTPMRCLFDIINAIVCVSMITVGLVKWNMCQIEPFIPRCLFGSGIAFLALGIIDKIRLCCIQSNFGDYKSQSQKIFGPILNFVLCSFVMLMLIVLTVLIVRALSSKGLTGVTSCDEILVFFTLFVLILCVVEIISVMVYLFICKPRDENKRRHDVY